jgi:uncharacterized protein (TIGR02611 family)
VTDRPRREPPKIVRKLQERRETHKQRHPVVRAAFVAVGIALVVGGAALLVLPGPAFVVIPIGLAILSLEFAWAGRLLDKSLIKADEARDKAAQASRTQKLLSGGLVAAAAVAVAIAVAFYDLPGPF